MARYRNIVELPVELIEAIYMRICPRCPDIPDIDPACPECRAGRPGCWEWQKGQADLSRLSRTCKSMAAVLQPLVFESFKGDADGCDSKRYVHRVVQLARSLEARPDLAGGLRSLSFAILPTPEVLGPAERQYVEETVVRVGDLSPRLRPGWNDDPAYRHDNEEMRYPLLPLEIALIRAPAIEYLQLPIGDHWFLDLLPDLAIMDKWRKTGHPRVVTIANPPADPSATFSFSHLHTVTLVPVLAEDLPYHRVDTEIPWAILQLAPNVRSISLPSDPGRLYPKYTIQDTPLSLPHLRRVHLAHTCIGGYHTTSIHSLLKYAPHIEALALQWAPLWIQHKGREERSDVDDALDRLLDTVGSIKGSIRELRLDVDEVAGPVKPGRSWKEHVSINGHVLRGLETIWLERRRHWSWALDKDGTWSPRLSFLADMFPPTIRTVTFWRLGKYRNYRAAMREFARDVAKGRYPNLDQVLMAPRQVEERLAAVESTKFDKVMSRWEPELETLRRDFSQGGVEFQIKREVIRWQYDEIW
ncbi:hypothetical protein B0J18DRAFT_453380 [Chaetomium sp. MPI-SDFR-AT-0129]|nr:hypothetical protein B0J18DRAFT_453380 [Chaetomium sp. MPI-SDFR-AT-0129]